MKTKFIALIIIGGIACSLISCKKYLDKKPDDKIATIATLTDAQLMLDYYNTMNLNYPSASEIESDNYYLSPADYTSRTDLDKSFYTWQRYESTTGNGDWAAAYSAVFVCNTVLDAYEKIMSGKSESAESKNVLGSALFYRAFHFYALSQLFAPIFDVNSASADMGIPIRVESDFTIKATRANNKETYDRIISDLKLAAKILPITPQVKSRPSKPAAYGALARVYLSMRDYVHAGLYADSCLQLYGELIDFNTLNKTSAAPFARFNKEVIFHIRSANNSAIAPSRAKIDQDLFSSYESKDLRKAIYFRANTGVNAGTYNFKGNLDGQTSTAAGFVFGGIVTDEMYLIRAEAYARSENKDLALKDLNKLLKTRWEGTYTDLTAASPVEALKLILKERRKELIYRGTRWTDLRRLSKEPELAVTPKRTIDGTVYELKPASLRYVLTIPTDVVRLGGIQQNQ